MTRDNAREVWAAAGLTYSNLTLGRVQRLQEMCGDEMIAHRKHLPGFGMLPKMDVSLQAEGFHIELRCRAFYFTNREAITFNAGGFIGFAGWADDINVVPILTGFAKWVEWMKGVVAFQKAGASALPEVTHG